MSLAYYHHRFKLRYFKTALSKYYPTTTCICNCRSTPNPSIFKTSISTSYYKKYWFGFHNNNSSSYQSFSFSSSSKTLSINNALKLLNLSYHQNKYNYTLKELRDAYFTAAKLCHPDSPNAKYDDDNHINIIDNDDDNHEEYKKEYLTNKFHTITNAYELLQTHAKRTNCNTTTTHKHDHDDSIITKSEEEDYKQACLEFLGVDAEIVEESKRCPLFREWLKGRTVDAFLWNLFLMKHGGLAPMLRRKKVLNIAEGSSNDDVISDRKIVVERKIRRRRDK